MDHVLRAMFSNSSCLFFIFWEHVSFNIISDFINPSGFDRSDRHDYVLGQTEDKVLTSTKQGGYWLCLQNLCEKVDLLLYSIVGLFCIVECSQIAF